ncbi:hypothetical protein [Sodalis sp. dw_96]|uniref:hypothetical protein n=1 Tax=Sodalis sp. dw_96 TaxID=2719794 RepID=UPI001BD6BE60|nr:hypothetical protein [Sodalis sp. dw_96]
MLINKKNVEINQSVDIGIDYYGYQLKMRVDKLVVILPIYKEMLDYDEIDGRLISMSKTKWKCYKISLEFKKKTGKRHPYWKGLIIRRKSDNKMLVRIDFEPRNKKTGAVRLEFGPQHMTPRELDMLLLWLAVRIGYNVFMTLLEEAWVTQVDVALDVYGCRLCDYVWGLKDASVFKGYKKKHGLPGLQLGSKRSSLHILCYEKVDAVGCDTKVFREKGGKLDLELEHFPRFLRIEARDKPGPVSQNHKCLMLSELVNMAYPFRRLQIHSRGMLQDIKMVQLMANRPEHYTLTWLKNHLCRSTESPRISRKIRRIIDKHELTLFEEEKVWGYWPECVARLGLVLTCFETQ